MPVAACEASHPDGETCTGPAAFQIRYSPDEPAVPACGVAAGRALADPVNEHGYPIVEWETGLRSHYA